MATVYVIKVYPTKKYQYQNNKMYAIVTLLRHGAILQVFVIENIGRDFYFFAMQW